VTWTSGALSSLKPLLTISTVVKITVCSLMADLVSSALDLKCPTSVKLKKNHKIID
jgi:hypothetical protein